MIMRSISVADVANAVESGTVSVLFVAPDGANRSPRARCGVSSGRRAQRNDPFDVEGRGGEDEERIDRRQTAELHLPQAAIVLSQANARSMRGRACWLSA